ncbi:alpha-1 2-mannosidase [Capsulimonas corticalis]|uniref:Alpha-1 2-mannosidase n=1 Tax=Capsulimonas corticalis TaxID=2219043 RepID=A0A402CUY1_9BACT|nr:GH92 family glycosyl hydrolase [Capsulimonas corticalis]BDI30228.1 alpha-1 2-mannosidase [Capsulimonas corticalis]
MRKSRSLLHTPLRQALAFGLLLPAGTLHAAASDPVSYVNPNIGNMSQLLVPTFPTVSLPNAMMRIHPERPSYISDQIDGLPLLLPAHRGGQVFHISPVLDARTRLSPVIPYTYDLEKTLPYRYSVSLDEQDIDVAFAPARRSAIYTFAFGKPGLRYLVLSSGDGELKADGNVVTGFQRYGHASVYLYLVASAAPEKIGVLDNGTTRFGAASAAGRDAALVLSFGSSQARAAVRYGVSYISVDQAKKNLESETPDFDLDKTAAAGHKAWNDALGKIQVTGGSENEKTVFYTALYRTYERMVDVSEDGKYYSGFDGKVHDDNGVDFYNDDWSWDTHRADHPLGVLINPKQESQKIASYIRMAEQSPEGWLPTFPELSGDGHCMNGLYSAAIIWDAYNKGLRGFDLAAAYAHAKKTVLESTALPWVLGPANSIDAFYQVHGYYPALKPGEPETIPVVNRGERRQSVAITLAASYTDWCLAQMAKALGKKDDYAFFEKRSYNYRNLFNPATGFFHPKDESGAFIEPLDYKFSGGLGGRDYYDENNGWTYRWGVTHNIADVVDLMGGRAKFVENLDQLFREDLGDNRYTVYASFPDGTGNVGQFSMGNEPSMPIPYFYNYAGAPWKTQKRVRSLLDMWFRNDLQGVPGDEDGGGLSAFAAFSSLGFYPVTAGMPVYNIGSPIFTRSVMDLGDGKTFVVEAIHCSRDNKYIQSAKLNGVDWNKPWFRHSDIAKGGALVLVMGNRPNKDWGAAPEDAPPSEGPLAPAP